MTYQDLPATPGDRKETRYCFQVTEHEAGVRLDKFLASHLNAMHLSRERLKTLILSGHVLLNNTVHNKVASVLQIQDTITLNLPPSKPVEILPEQIPLSVLFEDEHLLVVNKPSGMLTHPNGRVQEGTLVNALLGYCGNRLSGINGCLRPGIVHRLDRDTSGLMMVAKTDQAHQHLSAQLKARTVHRDYLAIVQGIPDPAEGRIEAALCRHKLVRDKMMIAPPETGRHAATCWKTLQAIGHQYSLLALSLETGRTHQIRVHMAHLGHPLVGDPQYGSGLEKLLKLKTTGQCLQAFRLRFIHPISLQACCFEIPQSEELIAVMNFLEQHQQG